MLPLSNPRSIFKALALRSELATSCLEYKLGRVAGLAFPGGPRFGLALPVTLWCRLIEPDRLVTSSIDRELSTGQVRLPVHLAFRSSLVFQLPFVYMFVWGSSFRSCTCSTGSALS